MIIEGKTGKYEWIEDWVKMPDSPSDRTTHAVAASSDGRIFVFHMSSPAVLIYAEDGTLISSWGDYPGAHGMTLIEEGGKEYLLLADVVVKKVVKTTLDGEEILTLPNPEHELYSSGEKEYVPTWATQNPQTGEIWVADGYGASLVIKFSPDGKQQEIFDGTEGAGRLKEPHAVNFVSSPNGPELFITDRDNHRTVVYDGEGKFLRSSMTAHSPSDFDSMGDMVLIPKLFTGVIIIDRESLELIDEFGVNEKVYPHPDGRAYPPIAPEGWPDLAGTEHIKEGVFNSPHGACFAPNGDIYVADWIKGGRVTKLKKL